MTAKGYAIHFGLDRVDDGFYAETYERKLDPLGSSAKDAIDLAAITQKQGFEVHLRTNDKATREEFLRLFKLSAQKMQAGDLLVISFSGHGGQAENVMFEDTAFDGLDELLCFYDDILLDDALFYHLCLAPAGSKIHLIIDSCHSGGAERMEGETEPLKLPFDKFRPEVRIENYTGEHEDLAIRAATIFWGSARPSALAGNGLFTQTLVEVWHTDRGRSNYTRFYNTLRQRSHPQYRPAAPSGVNNESFLEEKPFQII
jgi:hypothetical protein